MKSKLILSSLTLILLTVAGKTTAQTATWTDVTSTYISNPSFEADGREVKTSTQNSTFTGWTVTSTSASSFNNQEIVQSGNTGSTAFGGSASSDGSYHFFARIGWNNQSTNLLTVKTTTSTLPVGIYKLKADYKGAESRDNTSGSNSGSGSYLELSAIANATTLAQTSTAAYPLNAANNYFATAAWSNIEIVFPVTNATAIDVQFISYMKGGKRGDVLLDNIRLEYCPFPEATLYNGDFESTPTELLNKTLATGKTSASYSVPENDWTLQMGADWSAIGAYSYGNTAQLNSTTPPAIGSNTEGGNNLIGISAAWGNSTSIYQYVLLPAGDYDFSYDIYSTRTDKGTNTSGVFSVDGTTTYFAGTMPAAAATWETQGTQLHFESPTVIKVVLGMAAINDGSGGNPRFWFDNVKFTPIAANEQLIAYLETARAFDFTSQKCNATVQANLANAIAAGENAKTAAAIEAASNALYNAINAVNASIEAYGQLASTLSDINARMSNYSLDTAGQTYYTSNIAPIQTGYNNGTYADSDIPAAIANANNVYLTAFWSQTTPGADMTGIIVNPEINDGLTGWTTANGVGVQNNTSMPNSPYLEKWNGNASTLGQPSVKQTIQLNPGIYQLSALVSAENLNARFYANVSNGMTAETVYSNCTREQASVQFLVTTGLAAVEIGYAVQGATSNNAGWFACDDFTLTYVGPYTAPVAQTECSLLQGDYTLEVNGTVGTTITLTTPSECFRYTPSENGHVTFSHYGSLMYVYEGTPRKFKAYISPFGNNNQEFATPTVQADGTVTNSLLADGSFYNHGSSVGTDIWNFGSAWTTNVTCANGGIRVGKQGSATDGIALVWRGSGNENYFSQALTSAIKPSTTYRIVFSQVASGNANANFNVGFGNEAGAYDLASATVRLGSGQDGIRTVEITTPETVPANVYFTLRNTANNTASSGNDPVVQLDYIAVVEGTPAVTPGLQGATYASHINTYTLPSAILNGGMEDTAAEQVDRVLLTNSNPDATRYAVPDGWLLQMGGNSSIGTYSYGYTSTEGLFTDMVPATGTNANGGNNMLAVGTSWSSAPYVYQYVTLPAGDYNFLYDVYMSHTDNGTNQTAVYRVSDNALLFMGSNTAEAGVWETQTSSPLMLDEATDVKVVVGYQAANVGSGNAPKMFFDNLVFTPVDYDVQLTPLINQAAELVTLGQCGTTVKANLTSAIAAGNAASTTRAKREAIIALQTAIADYNATSEAFLGALDLITICETMRDHSLHSTTCDPEAFATAIATAKSCVNAATTVAAIEQAKATLEQARQTFARTAYPVKGECTFDMTFLISSPSFEEGNGDWQVTATGESWGGLGVKPVSDYPFDNADGTHILNVWSSDFSKEKRAKQALTLPNGLYRLKALIASDEGYAITLYAGSQSVDVTTIGANVGAEGTVDDIVVSEEQLEIGVFTPDKWFKADHFRLELIAPTEYTFVINNPSFETGDLTGWNAPDTGNGVEDMGVKENSGDYHCLGADGQYLFNVWWKGKALSQEIGILPAGIYQLSAMVTSGNDHSTIGTVFLAATSNGNTVHSAGSITRHGNSQWLQKETLTFVSNGTHPITISVRGGNDDTTWNEEGYWWYKADDFRLTYLGATSELQDIYSNLLESSAPWEDADGSEDEIYDPNYNYNAQKGKTTEADMLAAINYLNTRYYEYRWNVASSTHPYQMPNYCFNFDYTCRTNDGTGGNGRATPSTTRPDGTTGPVWSSNHDDFNRTGTLTLPCCGAYLLEADVKCTTDQSFVRIQIGDIHDKTKYGKTVNGDWEKRQAQFGTATALENVELKFAHGNENNGRISYIGGFRLYYTGKSTIWQNPETHMTYYFGVFDNDETLKVTDEYPAVCIHDAKFNGAITFDRTSADANPNGICLATTEDNITGINVVKGATCADFRLVDEHPFISPINFTATNARYTMTKVATEGENSFGTLTLPFNVTTRPSANAKAYALNKNMTPGLVLRATEVTGEIKQDTPVLVTENGQYSANDAYVWSANWGDVTNESHMHGTYTPTQAPVGSYVLQNHRVANGSSTDTGLGFYLVNDVQPTVKPFRCWITGVTEGVEVRPENKLTLVFENGETIVFDTQAETDNANTAAYDLSGRRIERTVQRGIYIKNGKKIVVR